MSPEVFREGAFKFAFWSGDRTQDPHVHAKKDGKNAKFWLIPDVELAKGRSGGMSDHDLGTAKKLIKRNRDMILEEWYDRFGN